jgi:hypothetical protein
MRSTLSVYPASGVCALGVSLLAFSAAAELDHILLRKILGLKQSSGVPDQQKAPKMPTNLNTP